MLRDLVAKPRKGHGRWSHTDLLLADIIDRLGHLGVGLRVYEKVPAPYARPGVFSGRKASSAVRAQIRALAEQHALLHGYSLDEHGGG